MSNSADSSTASGSITLHSLASHAKLRASQAAASPAVRRSFQFYLALVLFTGPAAARELGKVYCGTSVESLLTAVFGALVGIGIPATMFYVARSGLSYMRASGNPNQQNEARRDLILSLTGFGVIVLAIISPEIASKFFAETSNSISPCVRPLS
ncbi:pilin [Halomicroarcula sp. F28]|nr:pilin [Halomicroarcula salinisoli]MBX0288713.1 pilin [Halomicroarcula salinisoli]